MKKLPLKVWAMYAVMVFLMLVIINTVLKDE